MRFTTDVYTDFYHAYLSMRNELLKHFRRWRLVLAVLLATLIPLLFYVVPLVRDISFPSSSNSFAAQNLSFVSTLVIITGAFFAGDAISGEFEARTGLILFPTPQRKSSIFIGKYIAASIVTILIVVLYFVVSIFELIAIYGLEGVSIAILKSFLISSLYAFGVVSVMFIFSSTINGAMTSTLAGFFTLLLVLPIAEFVLILVSEEPWYLITYSGRLITQVFSAQVTQQGGPPTEFQTFQPDFTTGIEVMLAYAVVLFALSMIIASRKEME